MCVSLVCQYQTHFCIYKPTKEPGIWTGFDEWISWLQFMLCWEILEIYICIIWIAFSLYHVCRWLFLWVPLMFMMFSLCSRAADANSGQLAGVFSSHDTTGMLVVAGISSQTLVCDDILDTVHRVFVYLLALFHLQIGKLARSNSVPGYKPWLNIHIYG